MGHFIYRPKGAPLPAVLTPDVLGLSGNDDLPGSISSGAAPAKDTGRASRVPPGPVAEGSLETTAELGEAPPMQAVELKGREVERASLPKASDDFPSPLGARHDGKIRAPGGSGMAAGVWGNNFGRASNLGTSTPERVDSPRRSHNHHSQQQQLRLRLYQVFLPSPHTRRTFMYYAGKHVLLSLPGPVTHSRVKGGIFWQHAHFKGGLVPSRCDLL